MTDPSSEQRLAQHTPGPWSIDGELDKSILIVAPDPDPGNWGMGRLDCEVDSDDRDIDVAWANAHLIAAAPELLAALEAVLSEIGAEWDDSWSSRVYEQAVAAITKARGEAAS